METSTDDSCRAESSRYIDDLGPRAHDSLMKFKSKSAEELGWFQFQTTYINSFFASMKEVFFFFYDREILTFHHQRKEGSSRLWSSYGPHIKYIHVGRLRPGRMRIEYRIAESLSDA